MDKLIKAKDLFLILRDDIEINGSNFARVVEHLKNMSPMDAAEVVHGRWEYDHWCEFKCSICGEFSNSKPYKGKENYCPQLRCKDGW